MLIKEREAGDLKPLRALARREVRAEQKDRLMVPVLAIEGRETEDIMESFCRSRGFVQRWAYAYRDYRHLFDAGAESWQRLTPELLRSVRGGTYRTNEIQE